MQQKIMTELEDAIRNRPAAYGSHYGKQLKEKRAAKKPPEGATLKFSLLPAAEPEVFSPDALYDLSTDPAFASTILESYTGKKPTDQQISQLQARVKEKYPDLEYQATPHFESPKDAMKQMIKALDIAKTGNIKPYVNLIVSHPGIAPEFLEEAKKIKKAGYKETPETKYGIDAVKAQAQALTPEAKAGLLSHVEATGSFSSGFNNMRAAFDPQAFEANATPAEKMARSQDLALENSVKAIKAAKAARAEETPLRMREARNIEEEVENLKKSSERIAPMNATHDEAKALLRRGMNRDSLNLAEQEIRAGQQLNIPRTINPYLERSNSSRADFINQFQTDYAPVIEGFREEAAKDFLEHDLPQINSQFASKGAFFSGAREAAINKARADKDKMIAREAAKLNAHNHEQAMRGYHEHQGNALRGAEIAGHAAKAQQDAHIRAAEQHRVNTMSGSERNLKDVAVLSQIASAEQAQAQNEMNLKMAEYREEQERPFLELAKKSAIVAEHPIPPALFYPQVQNPIPPNPFGAASALLGQVAGLNKLGQQGQYAKGGHVRNKYAAGDSVSRAANELRQIQGYNNSGPHEEEMLREGRALKNERMDPMAQYLLATSAHQMANLHEDPLKSLGEGWKQGLQGHNAATIHNQESKQKYINLLGKINESRLEQQKLLANYHVNMRGHEETQRYHNMANAESIRNHDIMNERHTEKPTKMTATEKKLVNDAQKDLLRASRMKKEINNLGGLITQTDTGPVKGFLKSLAPKTKIDNKIEVATNKLILDMHQGMKNIPRSEEFLKRIETTKPNRSNYLEANKASLDMMNQGADDVMEHGISTLLSAGWSPEKIERQFKVKIPRHLLGEEGPEPESEESNEPSEYEGSVKMKGPDGIEYAIPQSQVQAAIQDGGRVMA